jgi:carbon-monoxide dehydrogenase small subunit
MRSITVTLNGQPMTGLCDRDTMSLLEFLRGSCGVTSARPGCQTGDCGCCNVLLDDKLVSSCLVLAPQADGSQLRTLESLNRASGEMSALQAAFVNRLAAQCGYCTSGQLMSATALLESNPTPSREEVLEAMSGNLCRCTGYYRIVDAVLDASDATSGGA